MMKLFRARLLLIGALLLLLGGGIITRLFVVQVVHGPQYAARSRSQAQERQVLKAKRGRILDCNGRVLAVSIDRSVNMDRGDFNKGDSVAGTRAGTAISRLYPNGEVAAAVLGYVGRDGYGLGGAEQALDRYLRGEDGWEIVQRDAFRGKAKQRKYRTIDLPFKAPGTGADVYLTINLDIQRTVETVLRQTLQKFKARGAMCIVMEPATGRILAMASVPSFNPNFPGTYSLEQRRNRCLTQNYEPGSTFKLVTAAAALADNIHRESDIIDGNNGVYVIFNQSIRDHEPRGRITFTDAMAYSSNVCFAKVANDIGNQRLYRYTRDFGFGSVSAIALPGEEAGIVHPVSEWSGRTRVTMAIGQEISVTFMQMIQAFSCIGNDGVLMEPRVCDMITDSAGTVIDSMPIATVRRVVRPDVARRLRVMLRAVVDKGTGAKGAIEGLAVAGKTGTSQKFNMRTRTYSDTLGCASFIGFVPADLPVLVCGVMVDEPANAEFGGTAAAPAFRQIITQIISNPALEYAQIIKAQDPAGRVAPATAHDAVAGRGTGSHRAAVASVMPHIPAAVSRSVQKGDAADTGNAIPDCRGRNLRDALNLLNSRGVVPYVLGGGMVKSQNPAGGSLRSSAPACTLYCSFEG